MKKMSMKIQISLYIISRQFSCACSANALRSPFFLGNTSGTINDNAALCNSNDNNMFTTTALSSCKYYEHVFSFYPQHL